MKKVSLLIIGGGPAGYVAALRATQLGARPTLVESAQLGGTCLNRGCVPTKALVESSGLLHRISTAAEHGIKVGKVSLDLPAMVARKEGVARTLREALGVLLPDRGVEIVAGTATFAGPNEVVVRAAGEAPRGGSGAAEDGSDAEERITFEKAIICTGSVPWAPPIPGLDLPGVIGSDEALAPERVPESLTVIGGGAVGCEFAGIYANLGSKVTIVELLPTLLPTEDEELGEALRYYFEARGVRVLTGAKVERVEAADAVSAKAGDGLAVHLTTGSGPVAVESTRVLAAIGRRPNTASLNLGAAGVAVGKRGEIVVDAAMLTNVDGIYAAGDATGGILLAHVGFEQGVVAAENVLGRASSFSPGIVPRCVYTEPEVAAVGLTEAAAVEEGYEPAVGRFPFANNGRALALAAPDGFVKVVAEGPSGQLLGVHIIGPHATELIAEAALALYHGTTIGDVSRLIHAHPTLSEAFKEAVLDARGEAIHK